MWEDVEGQEKFPVSAGFELTAQIQIYHAKKYIKKIFLKRRKYA